MTTILSSTKIMVKPCCMTTVASMICPRSSFQSKLGRSTHTIKESRRFHSGARRKDDDNLDPAENFRLLMKEYNIPIENTTAQRKYSRQVKDHRLETSLYAFLQESYSDRIATEYIHRTALNHGLDHNRITKSEIKSIFDKYEKSAKSSGASSSDSSANPPSNNSESEYIKQQEEFLKLLKL